MDVDARAADRRGLEAGLARGGAAQPRAGTEVPFATSRRATGRPLGSSRFMSMAPAHRRLEIGWTWLAADLPADGREPEVKLLQLEHAFETLGAKRVEFKTDARNDRSRAALAGIGATFEGVFRRHQLIVPDGRVRDSAWYAIVDEDWPAVRERLRRACSEGRQRAAAGGPMTADPPEGPR